MLQYTHKQDCTQTHSITHTYTHTYTQDRTHTQPHTNKAHTQDHTHSVAHTTPVPLFFSVSFYVFSLSTPPTPPSEVKDCRV